MLGVETCLGGPASCIGNTRDVSVGEDAEYRIGVFIKRSSVTLDARRVSAEESSKPQCNVDVDAREKATEFVDVSLICNSWVIKKQQNKLGVCWFVVD